MIRRTKIAQALQRHRRDVIKIDGALNGSFATDDPAACLLARQGVDSDEGVPLAMARLLAESLPEWMALAMSPLRRSYPSRKN